MKIHTFYLHKLKVISKFYVILLIYLDNSSPKLCKLHSVIFSSCLKEATFASKLSSSLSLLQQSDELDSIS